ncbi:MAG TPA: permease [Gemmatimonadaceae bacterium]|nr:permease [Gemmatimonadaceae bacterium]
MSLITALFVALALFGVYYVFVMSRGLRAARAEGETVTPTPLGVGTGTVTNFFDTLGIGSFATTTAIFRATRHVRDEKIPGTLNVGHTLPTITQAIVFTALFRTAIDTGTLVEMIIAAVAGAWVGARVFGGWPRQRIQVGMGLALLTAVGIMLFRQLMGDPPGGDLTKLEGTRLIIGLVGNFVLGMLMTLGIGLYAPCMILISMLGMNITAAFPVMMGSCAFLMPVASGNFIKLKAADLRASLGLLIGGIPGVLLAYYVVKSLPLDVLKWLVMAVVTYTAITLLLSARRERMNGSKGAPMAAH